MTTRSTITRAALATALLVLAGVLGWVAVTRESIGQSGAVPSLVLALLALLAAGLLFVRPAIGATLATLTALLGAGLAFVLNFCLCPTPPLGPEFVALYLAALGVFALALLQLAMLGLTWLAIAILVAVLAASGTVGLIVAGLLAAAVVAWLVFRRPRSGRGAPAKEG